MTLDTLFSSPAAGFDNPLDLLDGCHQRVRRNCTLVERIAAHLADEGVDEEVRVAAGSVLRYFDVAGRDHHRDEEEDLFPALLASATGAHRAGVEALLERLRADHVALDALWSEVRASLEAVRDGRGETLDEDLAARLARAYESHIAEEESVLFPLSRRLLSAGQLRALGVSMAARRGVKSMEPGS